VFDSFLTESYDGHTNKAKEILWKNSPTEIFKIMSLNKWSFRFKTAFGTFIILKTKTPPERNCYNSQHD